MFYLDNNYLIFIILMNLQEAEATENGAKEDSIDGPSSESKSEAASAAAATPEKKEESGASEENNSSSAATETEKEKPSE